MSSIDLVFILDASGSMEGLVNDTVGGFNDFVKRQRLEPGDAYVTLNTFDARDKAGPDHAGFIERFAAKPLGEVPELDRAGYFGGHGKRTALLDAVGQAITTYEALPVKADKTMFIITTDGEENASEEWTWDHIQTLVKKHQDAGWAFVFIGSNNSQWQGQRLGFNSVGSSVASPVGTRAAFAKLDSNTSMVRAGAAPAAETSSGLGWNS
jgi:uncharacterized protein YegL